MTAVWIILSVFAFLILLTLFLVFPATRRHNNRDLLKGMYIAHRGLHDNARGISENSLSAFKEAKKKGFAIENDIHLTADGEVVVFHDDNLIRMCGVDKKIEDLTLAEIKGYTLKNGVQTIPTLKECLDEINGEVPLLIEFKCASIIKCNDLCAAANEILKNYSGKYLIQSFFPMVLRWYRKNRPDICRGQLASAFYKDAFYKRLLGAMLFNFIGRPDFVSYDHLFKNNIMRRLVTGLGAFPVGWTFRSAEEVENGKKDFNTYIFEEFIPKSKQNVE